MLRSILEGRSSDTWSAALLLTAGAIVLGWGLQQSDGTLQPGALYALTGTLGLSLLALASLRMDAIEPLGDSSRRIPKAGHLATCRR